MGTKNNPGAFDCYDAAEPDEPMFILLGRDPMAVDLVAAWAAMREAAGEDPAKVTEARTCSVAMHHWLHHLDKPKSDALALLCGATNGPIGPSVPGLSESVAFQIEEGGGFWRSCSGCYETEDGHPVGRYPFSHAFKCALGGGCSECGGIGAIWDSTDYGAMAADMLEDEVLDEIYAECHRQVEVKGFTAEHDDAYTQQQLARAGAAYALADFHPAGRLWPWDAVLWKPTTHRRNLVKAAALIVKEIQRVDRAAVANPVREEDPSSEAPQGA